MLSHSQITISVKDKLNAGWQPKHFERLLFTKTVYSFSIRHQWDPSTNTFQESVYMPQAQFDRISLRNGSILGGCFFFFCIDTSVMCRQTGDSRNATALTVTGHSYWEAVVAGSQEGSRGEVADLHVGLWLVAVLLLLTNSECVCPSARPECLSCMTRCFWQRAASKGCYL